MRPVQAVRVAAATDAAPRHYPALVRPRREADIGFRAGGRIVAANRAFRRFGGVTAYSEGWGLYTEELGKDMGFYTDPYSDFGRLGMELWRAGRLVVDTGIHHKRWSREQAMAWLTENTPNPPGDIEKAIERYIVYPGQATAYMIGKLKIMELREKARGELGTKFDIREFHDVILTSGPVPLSIMEENVGQWIAARRQQ